MPGNVFGDLVDENFKGMEQWTGSLAVVTGASSGIGAAIAVKLVKAGVNVVGIARRLEKLEEMGNSLSEEKGTFHPKQCDISDTEELLATFEWVEETLGPIAIMINNAGVLRPTNLKSGDTAMWKETFDVNVLALCVCTRQALISMKKNEIDGHIVHVSSVFGYYVPDISLPEPVLNVLPATKYAVRALNETLRKELNRIDSKIKISNVSPGITASEFLNSFPAEALAPLANIAALKTEDVANAVLYILGTPPGVQVQDLILRAVGEKV